MTFNLFIPHHKTHRKLRQRVRGHFVMLIEVGKRLVICIPGRI